MLPGESEWQTVLGMPTQNLHLEYLLTNDDL